MCNIDVRGLDHARASARSTGMFLAALVIAMCALMMGAHDAYAITVRDDGNGYRRAIVYPYDYPDGRYAALTEFLGYDWNSFSQQTKTAIIEDDGKFMELYRARCKNYRYENENLQDGSGSVIGVITTKLAEVVDSVSGAVFGNDKTWYCSCTDADYEAACENIEQWLYPNNGDGGDSGDSGGGSGSGSGGNESIGDYVYLGTLDAFGSNTYHTAYDYTVTNGVITAGTNSRRVNSISGEYVTDKIDLYVSSNLYNIMSRKNKSKIIAEIGSNLVYVYLCDEYTATLQNNGSYNITLTNGIYDSTSINGTNSIFGYNNDDYKLFLNWSGFTDSVISRDNLVRGWVYMGDFDGSGNGGGSGTGGEPYEPTPDPTPTPPVIQIGDVTIDLSNGPITFNNNTYTAVQDTDNNWTISIMNNTTNNYGGDVQATDPTDYTSILNAILAAINSLRSEMTTYINQINTAINTMSTNIQTAIKNTDTSISGHIKKMKEQIHSDIQTLEHNIQDTIDNWMVEYTRMLWSNLAALDADLLESIYNGAVYIVDGLQFDGGWDDDEIVKWLKLIYSRVKDKKVTVRSVDEDPKGWLDDLKRVLDDLLNVILSGLNVATLATAFEGLKARFPISIPWDIAAIVNMFAGGAVTPVFDLPLPDGTNGSYTTVHVDLHEWDDEMALVRQGELILFGIVLMYNTKWMFDTVTMTFRRGE